MSILFKSILIFSFLAVASLYSLSPAGRVMTPINSSEDPRDRQLYDKDKDYDRDRGDRKYRDKPRVYNQYYYPYRGYSGYGYNPGYVAPGYGAPGYGYPGYYYPYVPGSAFPDDAAADELFDRLSK